MSVAPRILIAGIGNIFLGDDAFGVHVAQRLQRSRWPQSVRVVDFGIRGLDLVYELLEQWDAAILIDAVSRGQQPGTIFVIEPELEPQPEPQLLEAHSMDPAKVLRQVRSMGGSIDRVLLVGCEPAPLESDEEMKMELSPAVAAAVEPAARTVESLVRQIMVDHSKMENCHVHSHVEYPG